jgi:uncharacterized membrane protein YgdD (TMEM256/DUF423 family)
VSRGWAAVGALSAAAAVAAGAFGAHALKARFGPELLAVWETAARYQMYHALALLALGPIAQAWGGGRALRAAGWLFVVGTVLFSGSLYLLVLTGSRGLGALTPVGGVAFIGGWLCVAWGVARGR